MNFSELLDYAKSVAIEKTLLPDEASVWRSLCRAYSEKFSTPLHLCLDGTVDPETILLAIYEDQLNEFSEEDHLEQLLEQIYRIEDPDYEKFVENDLKDFIKKSEKEEKERIKKGKPIHPGMKNEVSLDPKNPKNTSMKLAPTELPKSGGINLEYLSREEEN